MSSWIISANCVQSFISRIKAGLSSGSSSSQTDATTAAHNDDIEAELFGFKPQSITLTKCECHVGSVRIAVSSSKHDALYNMMASHLEQILKAEIANTIATTIKEEFNAVLSKLNDRVAEQWHNLQMKTCQRLICTVVRAKVRKSTTLYTYAKLNSIQTAKDWIIVLPVHRAM
jgi:hypothetical protein